MRPRPLLAVTVLVATLAGSCGGEPKSQTPIDPQPQTPIDPPPKPPVDAPVVITNVTVIPMTSATTVLSGQTVVINNGLVSFIGTANAPIPAGAVTVDGTGKFLLPGYSDMHGHFTRREELFLYLANGITTLRNMAGYAWQVALRDSIRNNLAPQLAGLPLQGPNFLTAGPAMQVGGHPAFGGPSIDSPTAARNAIATQRQWGVDLVKVYTLLSEPTYRAILDEATKAGLPVGGHTAVGVGLLKVLQGYPEGRQSTVEHLDGYLPNGQLDAAEQQLEDLTIQNGVWNTFTLGIRVNQATLTSLKASEPDGVQYMCSGRVNSWRNESVVNHNLPEYRALIKRLFDRGAKLMIGSDAYATYAVPGFAFHRELEAAVGAGLTPYQALSLATRAPAEYLKRTATTGTVEVGKRADLVLLDANPLVDIRNSSKVRAVFINRVYYSRTMLDQMLVAADCPN